MKNTFLTVAVATATLVSCSTVSSVLQNTLPYNTNFVVTQGSPANTQLSVVGAGTNLNQIANISNNVKDISASTVTMSVTSGAQGMGVFQSVKVYISSGNNEVLVASRDNVADNIGNSLSLDVNSKYLDNVMKSGNAVQQRIVYVLKSSPTADMKVRSSISFSSVPITR